MTSLAAQVLLIAIVFIVFYVVLVRPQRLRLKQHREMVAGLRPGLRIATVGGLVGTIVSVDHADTLTLNVGGGVTITILRKSVDTLLEPAGTVPVTTELLAEQCAAA